MRLCPSFSWKLTLHCVVKTSLKLRNKDATSLAPAEGGELGETIRGQLHGDSGRCPCCARGSGCTDLGGWPHSSTGQRADRVPDPGLLGRPQWSQGSYAGLGSDFDA